MTRALNVSVVVTCLVATMTYAGAVTMVGMGAFVLPSVVAAALLGSFLSARRMSVAALVVGGVLVLGWSELVNVWSGTGDGPAARSTFVAAICTLAAVVAARSSSPALFLAPVAGLVAGALDLGAGGEVRLVAVATAVCAALTLGAIERARRNWTAAAGRRPALVLLSLLVGGVAAGVVLLQAQKNPRQPEALASGLAYPGIKPPWPDPLGMTKKSTASPLRRAREAAHPVTPQTKRPHRPPPKSKESSPRTSNHSLVTAPASPRKDSSRVWPYVLAGIVLLVLALLVALVARLLAVRIAWRRLRRRLAAGAPAEQITGAWAWMRLRLEAYRLPLPAAVSPDAVAAGRAIDYLPAEMSAPLQTLATATTTAAFAHEQSLGGADVRAAWRAAGEAEASAREHLTRRARVGLAFRGPARVAGTG